MGTEFQYLSDKMQGIKSESFQEFYKELKATSTIEDIKSFLEKHKEFNSNIDLINFNEAREKIAFLLIEKIFSHSIK